jgi:hypothetical protein
LPNIPHGNRPLVPHDVLPADVLPSNVHVIPFSTPLATKDDLPGNVKPVIEDSRHGSHAFVEQLYGKEGTFEHDGLSTSLPPGASKHDFVEQLCGKEGTFEHDGLSTTIPPGASKQVAFACGSAGLSAGSPCSGLTACPPSPAPGPFPACGTMTYGPTGVTACPPCPAPGSPDIFISPCSDTERDVPEALTISQEAELEERSCHVAAYRSCLLEYLWTLAIHTGIAQLLPEYALVVARLELMDLGALQNLTQGVHSIRQCKAGTKKFRSAVKNLVAAIASGPSVCETMPCGPSGLTACPPCPAPGSTDVSISPCSASGLSVCGPARAGPILSDVPSVSLGARASRKSRGKGKNKPAA